MMSISFSILISLLRTSINVLAKDKYSCLLDLLSNFARIISVNNSRQVFSTLAWIPSLSLFDILDPTR